MRATRRLAVERGIAAQISHFDEFWDDFSTYIELKHANGITRDQILAPRSTALRYDFESLLAREDYGNSAAYRFAEPAPFHFRLSEDGQREIHAALNVWTVELKGLTKMVTRINLGSQVRDCVAGAKTATFAA
jgi:hypothetical protein